MLLSFQTQICHRVVGGSGTGVQEESLVHCQY
jgi:hypothetical protein